jgi:histidine triad (HIT) family protein
MQDCIFCKIAGKEVPSEIVFESDSAVAFLDIRPINLGHTLVVPKHHFTNILDAPEGAMEGMIAAAKQIAPALMNSVKADGISIEMSSNAAAGQVIMHAHLHIIPRFKDDGLQHWPNKDIPSADLKTIAIEIRKKLSS